MNWFCVSVTKMSIIFSDELRSVVCKDHFRNPVTGKMCLCFDSYGAGQGVVQFIYLNKVGIVVDSYAVVG